MKLRINEKETPNIEVKNKGVLEVPEGKNVDDLPLSHFVKLANKKGLSKITKALNNLQVWNKNDDPKLSKWAGNMIDKLNKKLNKDESIRKTNKRSIKESLSFEDIEFVMNNYIQNKASGIEIINDDKKGNYKIKYNNEIVDLSFNLDDNTASYVYTINAEGPYSTNSYERITMDIKDYVDFNIEENTKLTIRESDTINDGYDEPYKRESYWKYSLFDRAIERIENSDRYFDERTIRQVKLYPCETEDECYEGDFWAVSKSYSPYGAVFGTKDEAYEELMYYLNNSMYEKDNDL